MTAPNWPKLGGDVYCVRCGFVQPWQNMAKLGWLNRQYDPNCVNCGFYPGPKR